MDRAVALLEQAEHLLREAAALAVQPLTDAELCDLTRRGEVVGRLADAVRVATAGEVAERSRHELGTAGLAYRNGCTRPAHLIERIALVSQREAHARIRLAGALRGRVTLTGDPLPASHPAVADAVRDGRVGVESAIRIIDMLDSVAARGQVHPDELDAAELELVTLAVTTSADALKHSIAVWQAHLDQDGARPREEVLRAQRRFTIGREVDGMTPFSGLADPLSAGLLRAAMAESTAPGRSPRFLGPGDLDPSDPDSDPRTRGQRQFDTLLGLVTAGLRSPDGGSLRPTALVSIVVSAQDLAAGSGSAWIDDVDTPISAFTAKALTCDADTSTIVLGDNGEVLHLGRKERLFTAAQRRALAIRYGGCIWPGCTAPPSWCHAHHLVEWRHNGPTDIDNGVLLCTAHHYMLHNSDYRLRMIRGKPHMLAPPHIDAARQWRALGRQRATAKAIPAARSG
ncbi:uncharacterized protein DUF222 [Diaminobutyricimonas aerilata]|uniref:Uncharacterized protein DUF222 n=1 Tax=Diaminobutyricimonas aerilata TaxID=1162967 RepID=A0A2M9CNY0_9MICO|nr:HNH endonuclease signature motif containing protein [Diaminobutyricimonas aerilata]PJJ73615.1 uncharacterized protein DUF222 [Diaminobutyricimonas aerilata]